MRAPCCAAYSLMLRVRCISVSPSLHPMQCRASHAAVSGVPPDTAAWDHASAVVHLVALQHRALLTALCHVSSR